MTADHGYCNLYTGTVSSTGTPVVMKHPKYRIVPHDSGCGGLAYKVQAKRWWGWSTVRSGLTESQAETVVAWLTEPAKYYDESGSEIESF